LSLPFLGAALIPSSIVSALRQLSPSTCFLLLDESCKLQRVPELLCTFVVVIIVIASDKRIALSHSSLSSLIGERAPVLALPSLRLWLSYAQLIKTAASLSAHLVG
jgi:hypothetical protein